MESFWQQKSGRVFKVTSADSFNNKSFKQLRKGKDMEKALSRMWLHQGLPQLPLYTCLIVSLRFGIFTAVGVCLDLF